MDIILNRIANVMVYIDDLLVHSTSHKEHIETLYQVLKRLVQHNIKINLQKCFFGSKEVSYLRFRLTEEGIKPGTDKLKAIKNAPPPSNVHEVRQFSGLCNFFWSHVRNFAQLKAPFTSLMKKVHLERRPTAARCIDSLPGRWSSNSSKRQLIKAATHQCGNSSNLHRGGNSSNAL
jgi:Reverse transcriptase (RNA-dependent DNA polymerase)